jgi:hypothetical protein
VLLSNSEWGPYPGCNLFFISFKKGIMKFIQTLLKTSITPQCLAFPLSWCVAILYCLIFIYLTIRIIRVEHYWDWDSGRNHVQEKACLSFQLKWYWAATSKGNCYNCLHIKFF